jgi:Protein of unknown function (DUF3078)
MKYIYLTVAAMLIGAASTWAQVNPTTDEEKAMKSLAQADSGWTSGGTLTLTSNLNYLSQWAAGGQSSLATNALLNYVINYRKGVSAWDNNLIGAFGSLMQPINQSPFKTDDKIDITTKYGRKLESGKWYYAVLGNFKSQFAPGYNFANGRPDKTQRISNFMAPAWALVSLGADFKPNSKLSVFISPITFRAVIVNDQVLANAGAFGVDKAVYDANGAIITPGKKLRREIGAYARINYVTNFSESVSWNTTLELFSNYRDHPQNVDVSWQSLFTFKLKKFMSATVFTHIIYDDNTAVRKKATTDHPATSADGYYQSKGVQFKSIIGLGLTFKL